jgi:hypothetical protein
VPREARRVGESSFGRRLERVAGAGEGVEEGVSLGVDLDSAVRGEDLS